MKELRKTFEIVSGIDYEIYIERHIDFIYCPYSTQKESYFWKLDSIILDMVSQRYPIFLFFFTTNLCCVPLYQSERIAPVEKSDYD